MNSRRHPTCLSCDFFKEAEHKDVIPTNPPGQCRESSPQICTVFDPAKEEHKILTRWPVVKANDWCGKHSDLFKPLEEASAGKAA